MSEPSPRQHAKLGELLAQLVMGKPAVGWYQIISYIISGLTGLFAVIAGAEGESAWKILTVITLVLLIPALINLIMRLKYKRILFIFGNGVLFRDGSKSTEIPYADISVFRLNQREEVATGNYTGMHFEVSIWGPGPQTKKPGIFVKGFVKNETEQHEQMAMGVPQLIERINQAFEERYDRDEPIRGGDVELTKTVLKYKNVSTPISELGYLGVFDDKISIWKKGEDSPAFTFDFSQDNVYPISHLVGRALDAQENPPEVDGLGRVLFERKVPKSAAIVTGIAGVIAFFIGFIMLTGLPNKFLNESNQYHPLIWGGAIMLGSLIAIIVALSLYRSAFRCRENGVHKRGLISDVELSYDEIETFNYSATKQFVNGVYTGTTLVMTFIPHAKYKKKKINYMSTSRKVSEDDLDRLRDHISAVIGGRMMNALAEGVDVQWGKNNTLTKDGIRYYSGGLLGKGKEQFLPYGEIASTGMQQGHYYIWTHDSDKHVMSVACAEQNFFPGFYLLTNLLYPPENIEQPADGEQVPPPEESGTETI